MKLEFDSIEELTIFYKKYIEPNQELKRETPAPYRETPTPNRDVVQQTQDDNRMNVFDLKKILK